jgi:oligopeptide transport system substrate-binding protein
VQFKNCTGKFKILNHGDHREHGGKALRFAGFSPWSPWSPWFILFLTIATAQAADPRKVLRLPVQSAERGFDCALESDANTGNLCDAIFDPLLQYDHLARPIKLQPRTAEKLPEISADGKTYTFKIKPGIYFTPDTAFNGQRRELVAADYVYSIKRLLDPAVKAQWQFLVDGKLEGGDALRDEAKRTGAFDYDKPIPGLEARDRHTFVMRLVAPDYNMLYIMAMPATAAVAREVVEKYGRAFAEHPVGTGAFKLKEWRRASRVVLEANPDYREEYFSTAATEGLDERDRQTVAHLKGKRLPLVGRIEYFPIEEEQPRWLAFLNGEFDYINPLPTPFVDTAVPGGRIAPNLARQGIWKQPDETAWITYTLFNMNETIDGKRNPVGGYRPENIALRRAMSMAYPVDMEIRIIEKSQAVQAWSPIAAGMTGYTDERTEFLDYHPARAKALLDTYGYLDRDGDGWREMPDGSPLTIDQSSNETQRDRSRNELWKSAMKEIGIRMTFDSVAKTPEIRRKGQAGRVQMWSYGWIADYPDGENFLQLFWSKSIGGANYSMFSMPEFDVMYEKIKAMPDSPERTALYRKMVHLLWVYNPWRVNFLKRGTILIQPWVIGYKRHPFAHEPWRYVDIDLDRLAASKRN